jgi:hypothetical protein
MGRIENMMKHYINRYLLVFLFVLLIFGKGKAQYSTGIGVRAGLLYGFSIKQGLDPSNYLEAIYGEKDMPLENSDVFQTVMTLMWEHNTRFRESKFQTTRLCWVYGIGGHYRYGNDRHAAGVDGTLGLEYQFFSVPFTVGIDAKPFYEFGMLHPLNYVDLGATLRFVFGN